MPIWDKDPHDELGKIGRRGPRFYPAATEVLDDLWGVDVMPTAVQPFAPLRDAVSPARRFVPSDNVMSLPLWRPGPPVAVAPPPKRPPLEAPPIERTAEELLSQAHGNLFARLRRDLLDAFLEESDEERLAEELDREVFQGHVNLLDDWACERGFRTSVTRRLGRRLLRRNISPEDAARELEALL